MINFLFVLLSLSGRVNEWEHFSHFGGTSAILIEGSSIVTGSSGGVAFGTLSTSGVFFDSVWTYPGKLSHNNVRCLSRDQSGDLWIGFYGGGIDLAHIDGTIQHFGQLEGLPIDLKINCVFPDTAIWAGTTQGLCIRNLGYFKTWTASNTGGGLPDNCINCFVSTDLGMMVGTSSGLVLLKEGEDPGNLASWLQIPEMSNMNITDLLVNGDTIWATSTSALYITYPGSVWYEIESFPGISPACMDESGGKLAVGCQESVWVFDGSSWSKCGGLGGEKAIDIEWLDNELLVLGLSYISSVERLSGKGTAVGYGNSWHFSVPAGAISNDLFDVSVGPYGECWISSNHQGGGVYHDGAWTEVRSDLSNVHQIFSCSSDGVNGAYFAPWHHGVTWIQRDPVSGEITDFVTLDSENSGLLNNQANEIVVFDNGFVWFALEPFYQTPSEPSGVCRLDWILGDETSCAWRSIQPLEGLPSGYVECVVPVNDAEAWAGTDKGLVYLNVLTGNINAVYDATDGLPSDDILALALRRNGDLFVRTVGGLAFIEKSTGSVVPVPEIDGNDSALCVDNLDGVWTVSSNALCRLLSDGSIEKYNTFNSPLLSLDIRRMCCDPEHGYLYLTTGNGLWRLHLENGLSSGLYGPVVYPNPFLPGGGEVLGVAGVPDLPTMFRVFDLNGTLLYEFQSSGRDGIAWDGIDMHGFRVASGTYFVQIIQEGTTHLVKLALVR